MIIGERLRQVREEKKLSQGDVEKRTGLFRCYVSRVENGHTIPSVETLEKFARALDMKLYQLLYEGPEPPPPSPSGKTKNRSRGWGIERKEAPMLSKLRRNLSRMSEGDRAILMSVVSRISQRRNR